MKKYIIALKYIGLDNQIINFFINTFNNKDFLELFQAGYLNLQFKYNYNMDRYSKLLSDIEILNESLIYAKKIIDLSKDNSIKMVLSSSKHYPINLKQIKNCPPILYYKGRGFYKKHEKSLACIGTRNITNFGIDAVNSLIPNLVSEGFTIISGLANGVDEICHKVCLENNGTTIAVLAHGLDFIYPKSNTDLANQILENNGLLVSEYPVGTSPDKFRFIERNKIVAGLSKGAIAFEGKEKSGTMHTVNDTIKENRKVFVPYTTLNIPTTGLIRKLLKENKAIPIPYKNSFETIVLNLGYKLKDKVRAQKVTFRATTNLVTNTKITSINHLENLNFESNKKSSFSVDSELYKKFKIVLDEYNITIKDIMNTFMQSIVDTYYKGDD